MQPKVLLVPRKSETRGNDSRNECCERAQPGHGVSRQRALQDSLLRGSSCLFQVVRFNGLFFSFFFPEIKRSIGLISDTNSIGKIYPSFVKGQDDLTIKWSDPDSSFPPLDQMGFLPQRPHLKHLCAQPLTIWSFQTIAVWERTVLTNLPTFQSWNIIPCDGRE